MSDAFQFTWRYQLPALITLPPAAALGLTALFTHRREAPAHQRPGAVRRQGAAITAGRAADGNGV